MNIVIDGLTQTPALKHAKWAEMETIITKAPVQSQDTKKGRKHMGRDGFLLRHSDVVMSMVLRPSQRAVHGF